MQTQAEKLGNRQRAWLMAAVALGLVNLGGWGSWWRGRHRGHSRG